MGRMSYLSENRRDSQKKGGLGDHGIAECISFFCLACNLRGCVIGNGLYLSVIAITPTDFGGPVNNKVMGNAPQNPIT